MNVEVLEALFQLPGVRHAERASLPAQFVGCSVEALASCLQSLE